MSSLCVSVCVCFMLVVDVMVSESFVGQWQYNVQIHNVNVVYNVIIRSNKHIILLTITLISLCY